MALTNGSNGASTDVRTEGPVVIVGFADALAAAEVCWSLQHAGFSVVAFCREGDRPALRRLRDVRLVTVTAPESDASRAVADIVALARSTGAAAIMPLNDSAVWLLDAASGDLTAKVAGPIGEAARLALDKGRQLEAARAAGYRVPLTLTDDTEGLLDVAPYPCVVKPALAIAHRDGRLVSGPVRKCADRTELQAALRELEGTGRLLIQEHVAGRGEGIFGLAADDGIGQWSGHRRVRMMNPAGSGSSACVSIPIEPEVRDPAQRLLEGAGWRGLFMVELLRDPSGHAWFMEINGRAWGSMALARRSGLEYPAWAVQDLLGLPRTPGADGVVQPIVCRHLGRELVHLMFVLRGPRTAAGSELWPTRLQTLRALLRVGPRDRWYNWERGSTGFFLADAMQTVARAVVGAGRR
jgi:predicted ATP-grasp superfamily ATP-dependent carboligase